MFQGGGVPRWGNIYSLGLVETFGFVISSMGVRRRRRRQRRAWVLRGPIGLGECDWGCWRDGKRAGTRNRPRRLPRPKPEMLPGHCQHTRLAAVARQPTPREKKEHSDTEKPSGCMEAYRSASLFHRTWRPFSGRGKPAPDVHLRSEPRTGDGDGTGTGQGQIFTLVPWPGLGGW